MTIDSLMLLDGHLPPRALGVGRRVGRTASGRVERQLDTCWATSTAQEDQAVGV